MGEQGYKTNTWIEESAEADKKKLIKAFDLERLKKEVELIKKWRERKSVCATKLAKGYALKFGGQNMLTHASRYHPRISPFFQASW